METTKLIQTYYQSFNDANMDKFFDCLSDEVVHDINQGGSEQGKGRFIGFMERMNHCYKEKVRNLVVMIGEDGSRASAEFEIEGIYLNTDVGLPEAKGQTYSLPCGAFFEVKQGKITRVTNYYNLKDWLKQVQS